MNKRTLSLKREALTELGTAELSVIAGGSHIGCGITHGATCEACVIPTLPLNPCLDDLTQRTCPTISPDICVWETR